MADDQEKTDDFYNFNKKRTSPFFYANRYGTKEKSKIDFCVLL
ncbi:hypothetical protein [Sulfurimonas sp.]|nr:hypothetical protein [Sulfurimonas sp.]